MNLSVQWLLVFYVANQILSCMVQALPEPTSTSGMGYRFVYKFLSLLIADFKSFSDTLPKPVLTTSTSTGSITTTSVPQPASSKTVIVETQAAQPVQNVGIL
jgi:predicted membrane protein